MDIYFPPDLESANPPMVIVAAADKTKSREKVLGVCMPVDTYTSLSFGGMAQKYLMRYAGKDPADVDISRVQIKLLAITRQPEHGHLEMYEDKTIRGSYGKDANYFPDEGYLGKDRVEALVAVGEDIVRVIYDIVNIGPHGGESGIETFDPRFDGRSVDQLQDYERKKLCPKGPSWRISDALPENSPLSTLLYGAQSAFQGFSDLPGVAVAQTTGTGAYGQITLDTTAAGYTWYLDPTPFDNTDDYLPTADPNIWKAKPDSEAAGKMDLLSVLLHEYAITAITVTNYQLR
ncbi:MAG: hypothetical protein FWD50_07395 [Betaproteobacteria bacterium]|nr:hypothetical protein [Betaproteobacteria bacterium]